MVVVCPDWRVLSSCYCYLGILLHRQVEPQVRQMGGARYVHNCSVRILAKVGMALQETNQILETLLDPVPYPLCRVCTGVLAWMVAPFAVGSYRIS